VVEDVDVLHHLLQTGVRWWGQLQSVLQSGRRDLLSADQRTVQRIEATGAALQTFVSAWSIGRGDPVRRDALEDSGAVSDTFIDEVSELAERLSGHGSHIVQALLEGEVTRFHRSKARDLEAYLEEHGYIDRAEPLSEQEISRRMVGRLLQEGLEPDEARRCTNRLLERLATALPGGTEHDAETVES
jgi:hypothetical protein